MEIVIDVESIFEQGNKHMETKLRHFGSQGQAVIKYIISKLRLYHGDFFESNKTIAAAVECHPRTVQNAIKRAEQLEIFIVSSRTEETFDEKMRQTSNKIQLLSYTAVEVVKEIVETVRSVASKVVKKVTRKKISNNNSNSYQKPQKAHIPTKMSSEWVNMFGEDSSPTDVLKQILEDDLKQYHDEER